MSRAAACFQGRILRDSFLWRIHVAANYKCDSHKINSHLNKRYLGLLECDAAASSEWFPTFRKKVSSTFPRVMWTKVFDLWEGRRYFLSTRRELSSEDRASCPRKWAPSGPRLLRTKNSQHLFIQCTDRVRQAVGCLSHLQQQPQTPLRKIPSLETSAV